MSTPDETPVTDGPDAVDDPQTTGAAAGPDATDDPVAAAGRDGADAVDGADDPGAVDDPGGADDAGAVDDDAAFAAAVARTEAALKADDELRAVRTRRTLQVGAGTLALALSVVLVVYLAASAAGPSPVEERAADPSPAAAPVQPPRIENWIPPTATPGKGSPARPRPADAFAGWARQLAELGIPLVALQAYGYTEAVLHQTQPNCRLSWTLLAGIGAVESDHGRYGGARLKPDGTSEPRIVGVPLDGTGTKLIPDTDNGLLDGDRTFDRAVGAMQFIPATWNRWAVDGDADGKADPYDLDDAVLAAGYYLCANGRDLSTGGGWWNAVLSYNHLTPYANRVFEAANRYGRASRTAG